MVRLIRRYLRKIKKVCRRVVVRSIFYRGFRKIYRKIHKKNLNRFAQNAMKKAEIEPRKIAIMTNTDAYTCNPRYIYEEIIRRQLNCRVVWIVKKKKTKKLDFPDNIHLECINTKEGLQEVYSSKIWLDNGIAFSNYFDKKEGQIHIQTMHGSLGIKRLDNAVTCRNERGEEGQRVVYRESNETDYVITNSQFEEDVFRTVFWKETPMVRFGHARTDILFSQDQNIIDEIRRDLFNRYGIPMHKKLVLYAPTHRKGLIASDLICDYQSVVNALDKKFGGEHVIMTRMHKRTKDVMVAEAVEESPEERIMFDVTNYPDIQQLMLVTSLGITDYSSWIYDYVVTSKAGIIFATDTERYNNNTGLYYPLEATPFPVAKSEKELIQAINNYDMDVYKKKVKDFLEEKEAVDDGHSAERIVDWIETLLG